MNLKEKLGEAERWGFWFFLEGFDWGLGFFDSFDSWGFEGLGFWLFEGFGALVGRNKLPSLYFATFHGLPTRFLRSEKTQEVSPAERLLALQPFQQVQAAVCASDFQ